jgi:ABC-type uncharacterized transport system involved in gliding motility auxiliary subunit
MKKSSKRVLTFWSNFLFSTLALIGVLVILNLVSTKSYFMKDLTEEKLFTLSDQTLKVLEELDRKSAEENKEVKITAFLREGEEITTKFEQLTKLYGFNSKRLSWEIADPEKKPRLAAYYQVKTLGTVVVEFGDKQYKVEIDMTKPESLEEVITNTLVKIARGVETRVCFTEGQGEREPNSAEPNGISIFAEELKKQGYQVGRIRIWEADPFSQCDIVLVVGPVKKYTDSEKNRLSEYLLSGGRAIFFIDPEGEDFADILDAWGIGVDSGLVVDPSSRMYGASPAMPVITEFSNENPITKDFKFAVIMAVARRVHIKKNVQGLKGTEIMRTSSAAWEEMDWKNRREVEFNEGVDVKGPIPVAVAAEGIPGTAGGQVAYGTMQNPTTVQARLVVFGDSDFITNGFINIKGNLDVALNAVEWVAEKESLISIRPKERKRRTIVVTPEQIETLRNLLLFVMPPVFFVLAFFAYVRKRRL